MFNCCLLYSPAPTLHSEMLRLARKLMIHQFYSHSRKPGDISGETKSLLKSNEFGYSFFHCPWSELAMCLFVWGDEREQTEATYVCLTPSRFVWIANYIFKPFLCNYVSSDVLISFLIRRLLMQHRLINNRKQRVRMCWWWMSKYTREIFPRRLSDRSSGKKFSRRKRLRFIWRISSNYTTDFSSRADLTQL